MQITSVGHAGFHIQTEAGSILCDPWVTPTYFASWVPFPDNTELDWDALGNCDYLYVSHLHKDHFDPKNLIAHVNKDATVLLPDYPVPDLKRELEKLGFHKFFETEDSVKHTVSGPKGDLDIMIIALRAPADGPIGDSGLVVSDGETTCFNMNDARPVDLDPLTDASGRSTSICCSTRARSGTRWSTTSRRAPSATSASRSVSAAWTAAATTSPRSTLPGLFRRPARRSSSTTTCVTSTTITATRETSSPTRSRSSSRCASTATIVVC